MKMTMAVMKHNRATVGTCEGHNARLHATKSQLPKAAWFDPKGRHAIAPWRGEIIGMAKKLAKRKDAVLAIELIIQIGNQSDWRELPTETHPYGKPKAGAQCSIRELPGAVKRAAIEIFGENNIIGIDLHLDESSPHCHVAVAPIHACKLQAKHWLNGPAMVAQLRERIHRIVNDAIPCTYEKGGNGGVPHDPGKAAGAAPVPTSGLIGRLKGAVSNVVELEAAKARIKELEAENAALFSKLKRSFQTGLDRQAETQSALAGLVIAGERIKAAEDRATRAEARANLAEGKLMALSYDPEDPTDDAGVVLNQRSY